MSEIRSSTAVQVQSNDKPEKLKNVKIAIECVVGGLVDMFMMAVTKNIAASVGGSKLAKLGVRAGGFLVSMYIGGRVSDYVCESVEDTLNTLEDVKHTIETGGQANG